MSKRNSLPLHISFACRIFLVITPSDFPPLSPSFELKNSLLFLFTKCVTLNAAFISLLLCVGCTCCC